MATSTATAKVINFGEVMAAKERNQDIMDMQLPNFEDCRSTISIHKNKRNIEHRLNDIAVSIMAAFSVFMIGLNEFFGMLIIYKTINPATLETFLFIAIILGLCLMTIYGCMYFFVKERICRKR